MYSKMVLGALLISGLFASFGQKGCNQAKEPTLLDPKTQLDEREVSEAKNRINYLIDLLVSKNAPPPGNRRKIKFPDDYDEAAQVQVYLAFQKLLQEGELALDPLFSHEDDSRYSFSVKGQEHDYNVDVSWACNLIARKILFPYEHELHLITRDQYQAYPQKDPKEPWSAWWSKHKHKGLLKIQLEAIAANIKFFENVDGKTAKRPFPEGGDLPIDVFNAQRDENIRMLKANKQYIELTGNPYTTNKIDTHSTYIIGLPWRRNLCR
jgi:hypothetical protein